MPGEHEHRKASSGVPPPTFAAAPVFLTVACIANDERNHQHIIDLPMDKVILIFMHLAIPWRGLLAPHLR
jgi:hypothetical protein